jgi:predicted nucleotidyltransferase component of viral defense system
MSDEASKAYHEAPGRFRDALMFTASETGFSERLIEKDYYCSVLLKDMEALFSQGIVFKGGTCLSKIHGDFFRLSEDLDFGISVKFDAPYKDRRERAAPLKAHFQGLAARLSFFSVDTPVLSIHNQYKHVTAKFHYTSLVPPGDRAFIKVEFSLREETLLPANQLTARTILIDPLTNSAVLTPISVRALSLQEAYAEKTRAALTRRDPAIRDFFDLDNAIRKGLLKHGAPEFLGLVAQKLAVTDDPVDLSPARLEVLARQIETQLKPVLRTADYEEFVLDRMVALLHEIASAYRPK